MCSTSYPNFKQLRHRCQRTSGRCYIELHYTVVGLRRSLPVMAPMNTVLPNEQAYVQEAHPASHAPRYTTMHGMHACFSVLWGAPMVVGKISSMINFTLYSSPRHLALIVLSKTTSVEFLVPTLLSSIRYSHSVPRQSQAPRRDPSRRNQHVKHDTAAMPSTAHATRTPAEPPSPSRTDRYRRGMFVGFLPFRDVGELKPNV